MTTFRTVRRNSDQQTAAPKRRYFIRVLAALIGLVAMAVLGLLAAPAADAQSSDVRVITAEDTDNDDDPDVANDERLPAEVELFVDGIPTKTLVTSFTGVLPSTSHDNLGTAASGSTVVVCQEVPENHHFIVAEIGGVAQLLTADPDGEGRTCVTDTASTSNINVFFLNEQSTTIQALTAIDTDGNRDLGISVDERVPAEVELFINGQSANTLITSYTGIDPAIDNSDALGSAVLDDIVTICASDIADHIAISSTGTTATDPDGLGRTCASFTIVEGHLGDKLYSVTLYVPAVADINVLTLSDVSGSGNPILDTDDRVQTTVEFFINGQSVNTVLTSYSGIEEFITTSDALGIAALDDIVIVCAHDVPNHSAFSISANPAIDPDGFDRLCGTFEIGEASIITGKIDFLILHQPDPTAAITVLTISDTDRSGTINLNQDERVLAEVELFVNNQSTSILTTSHTGIEGSTDTLDVLGSAFDNATVVVCVANIAGHTSVNVTGIPNADPDGKDRTCGRAGITESDVASGSFNFNVIYFPAGDLYNPVPPSRILDTRPGFLSFGQPSDGPDTPIGPGDANVRTLNVSFLPNAGIPVHVNAVALHVTSVSPTANSFLTIWSDGPRPNAASKNFGITAGGPFGYAGLTNDLLIVPVGPDGSIQIYNDAGTVDLVIDIVGYYGTSGDLYNPLTPSRILDTRPGFDSAGNPADGLDTPIGAGEVRTVEIADLPLAGVPLDATAVALHVTSVGPTANSFLTIWPDGIRPNAASKNYGITAGGPFGYAGLTNDLLIVPVGPDGTVQVYNDAGTVDLVIDVVGYYATSGDLYLPLTPSRILDTRPGFDSAGNPADGPDTPIGAGDANTRTIRVADLMGAKVTSDATAVAIHVTSVGPTADSFLSTWSDGVRPNAASKNFGITAGGPFGYAGLTNDLLIVPVGPNGTIQVYNDAGTVDLVIDIVGYTIAFNPPAAP